jgi:hypothetical protein
VHRTLEQQQQGGGAHVAAPATATAAHRAIGSRAEATAATARPSLAASAEGTSEVAAPVIVIVIVIVIVGSWIHVVLLVRVLPAPSVGVVMQSRYIVIASLTTCHVDNLA